MLGFEIHPRAKFATALAFSLIAALMWSAPARAQQELSGIALVIGQSEYEHLAPLTNPANDADAVEELLSDLGFDTTLASDRDARQLRRVLDGFVEDAGEADVAILYYAGHGIEAGGENYLVPVDADLDSLGAASEHLVAISAYLERLKSTVPVTILMLDACRDNPFPADAMVRKSADEDPVPMGTAGLGETRGATRLTTTSKPEETYGTVIAFAAEPGRAALDGEPGANSPYTAAILRHLDAMAGQEFGTVMRLVAEEVYLKTGGRQQPWVNESLRRLLFFGETPEAVEGPEGEILRERRGLLLTIADLPEPRKADAQRLAQSSDVPMSVVFAMMKAAGIDRDEDPATVEKRLRDEISRFAEARQHRDALTNPDEELARLTALADEAELEGALHAANELREQAKVRVASLRGTREQQIAALRERILEDADIFARSAETKTLLFQHRQAATDFGEARSIVADWAPAKAAEYRSLEIAAYLVDGELNGSMDSLAKAERLAREALASGADTPRLHRDLAVALMLRGARANDVAVVAEARRLIESALADTDELALLDRANLQIEAGRAVGTLALIERDDGGLLEAGTHFRHAIDASAEAGDTSLEAEARFRLVQALYYAWSLVQDAELWTQFYAEMEAFVAMIEAQQDDVDPLSLRYIAQTPAITLELALRQNSPDALRTASEINGIVAEMFDREKFPLIWAGLQMVEGRIGLEWSDRFGDPSLLQNALEAQRAALGAFRQAGASSATLEAEWNEALTLASIGIRLSQPDRLRQSKEALAQLARRDDVSNDPTRSRSVSFQEARVGAGLAAATGVASDIDAPIATLSSLLDDDAATADQGFRAQLQSELGKAIFWRAQMNGGNMKEFRRSADLLGEAVEFYRSNGADTSNVAPFTEIFKYQADALANLALMTGDMDDLREAVTANRAIHEQLREIDQHDIAAITANTAAFLIAQLVRASYDEPLLAVGEDLVAKAISALDRMPALAGYFRNTECELTTERARAAQDVELARTALDQCRAALATLKEFNNLDAIPTSERSVRRAETLVQELDAG